MAELRLAQLNERDRLYNILNQDYEFTYTGVDSRTGIYPTEITYTRSNPFRTNKNLKIKTNEVMDGIANRAEVILTQIQRKQHQIGTNILPDEYYTATHPDSRMIGYPAILKDLQNRNRGQLEWHYPHVPEDQPYANQRQTMRFYHKDEIPIVQAEIDYLELVYLENFGVKQMTITSTFKEKLDQEKLKSEIELQTLQAQLGIAQKSLETETLESESAKLDFQQSHSELLTFNKLINKIEELHEPEPVKTGFRLESIDAKKLLIVGLGLIGVVILLIVVKNK